MPNYDIIPMAADLLDYTIQRVKAVEPEYKCHYWTEPVRLGQIAQEMAVALRSG